MLREDKDFAYFVLLIPIQHFGLGTRLLKCRRDFLQKILLMLPGKKAKARAAGADQ